MKKIRFLSLLFASFILSSCSLVFVNPFKDSESDSIPDGGSLGNIVNPSEVVYQSNFDSYKDLSKRGLYKSHYSPSTGDINVLVIPVAFSDSNKPTNLISDLNKVFNGTSKETGWESFASYFNKSSYGNLNLKATIAPTFFTYNKRASYLGIDDDKCSKTSECIQSAVDWYKNTYDTDLKEFDSDNDGFIDSVICIYAEHNYYVSNNGYENFWAYTYFADNSGIGDVSSPKLDCFMWASYDFMYSNNGYGSQYINLDAHTYIHEFGHCMGLQDYYNYDRETSSKDYQPAGGFDMQDHNLGDHNPFSKLVLGWSKPYVVNGEGEITLTISSLYQNQYVLIPSGGYDNWNNSPFDEYMLLELYAPKGLNEFDVKHDTYGSGESGPSLMGIRLYHIDARVFAFKKNTISIEPIYDVGYVDNIDNSAYVYNVAASNSTSGARGYCSYVNEALNYKLVHLISASGSNRVKSGATLSNIDLFRNGDIFKMSTYKNMFHHEGYMNEKYNGEYKEALGYGFEITDMTSGSATIRIFEDN